MLLAAGSGLFLLLMHVPDAIRRSAGKAGLAASGVAAIAFVLSVGLGGAEMMTGPPAVLLAPSTWALALDTTLGTSAGAGILAMAILGIGFKTHRRPIVGLGI